MRLSEKPNTIKMMTEKWINPILSIFRPRRRQKNIIPCKQNSYDPNMALIIGMISI